MHDRSGVALALWPPDDTEESVSGTNLHQTAILTLRSGINEAAAVAAPEGMPVPWQAGGQTMVRGLPRWDGSEMTTLPDVFVYRKPWDDERGSLHLAADGPPVLIIEVLSKETSKADLDLEKGKGYSYARAGVIEYLTLDPAYRYTPDGGTGWRLEGGVYRPWRREGDGRWASQTLPLSFGLEGALSAVYASDGHRFLRVGEVERTLRQQRDVSDRRLAHDMQERRRAEAKAEEQRLAHEALEQQAQLRAEELERLRREYATEVEQLRRRLDEMERDK